MSSVLSTGTPSSAIFTAQRDLETLLANNKIPARIELGSRLDCLLVHTHSHADGAKLRSLLKKDPVMGVSFQDFQVLILNPLAP